MNEATCKEKHIRVDEVLAAHGKELKDHDIRLDKLEVFSGVLEERLDNLISKLSELNVTLKWFIALMVGAFVGFFFYVVQHRIF